MKRLIKILLLILITFNITSCNAYVNQDSKLQENIQTKLNNILDDFYKKLEKKYPKNSDRIKVLETINSRIEKIKSRKNLKNRTIKILNYLKENIFKKIKEYKPHPNPLLKGEGINSITPQNYQNMLNLGIDVNWANYDGYMKDYKSVDPINFKKRGFDHVRIRFKKDTPLAHLKKVVDDSLKAGLIPIIAYGAEELKYNPDENHIKEVVEKWKKTAEFLKDEDYKVAFDLIIEVGKDINKHPEILSDFQIKVIKAIRETGGKNKDRIIMISGIKRGNPEFLETLKVPNDKFIMLEWHFYAAGPSKTGKYVWTTGTEKEKEVIRKRIALASEFTKKHNLAEWIGAWMPQNWNHTCDGVYDKRTTVNLWTNKQYDKLKKCPDFYEQKQAIDFAKFLYTELRKHNIPSAINADGKFYDKESHSWLEENKGILDELMGVKK